MADYLGGLVGLGFLPMTDGPPPALITNFEVQVFDACIAPDILPQVRMTWDQVVPSLGQSFGRYYVLRRDYFDSDEYWILDEITNIATTSYIDYTPRAGVGLDYAVVWVDTSTGDISTPVPIQVVLKYDFTWVHLLTDPTTYAMRFFHDTQDDEQIIEAVEVNIRGRQHPSVQFGEEFYQKHNLSSFEYATRDGSGWRELRQLLKAQADNTSLACMRVGVSREVTFGNLTSLGRARARYGYAMRTSFVESTLDRLAVT